jgi:predicted enzyme related to lactoylglutathione lyase
MSSNVFGVSFEARDANRAATFWAAALGGTVTAGGSSKNAVVEAPNGTASGLRIGFHAVPEDKTVKNRMHFDLIATEFAVELERLIGLGATALNEVRNGAHWVTLSDPEGNEFDLIDG